MYLYYFVRRSKKIQILIFSLMRSTFNIIFSNSLVFLIESVFDLVFLKKSNQNIKKIKKYLDKRTKMKRKKQQTKMNLDCLLDQAIGEKNKFFTYKKIIISHNKIKKGDQPLKKKTKKKHQKSHILKSQHVPCS
jgi:hypothetical protein